MIKKSILLLLVSGLVFSCNLLPRPEKNKFSFDIHGLQSEDVKKISVRGSAHSIQVSLTGNISDSLTVQWGGLGNGDTLQHPYQRFVLPPGKVNYLYKGDFYSGSFFIKHTPFENSAIEGVLKVDVNVYATGD